MHRRHTLKEVVSLKLQWIEGVSIWQRVVHYFIREIIIIAIKKWKVSVEGSGNLGGADGLPRRRCMVVYGLEDGLLGVHLRPLSAFPGHDNVPVVLHGVIGAAGEKPGDYSPPVSVNPVRRQEALFLLLRERAPVDSWIQLVEPS